MLLGGCLVKNTTWCRSLFSFPTQIRNARFALLWHLVNADTWITVCFGAQNLKGSLPDGEELTDHWSQRNVSSASPAFLFLPCWACMGSGIRGQPKACLDYVFLAWFCTGRGPDKEPSSRGALFLGT